MFVLPRAYETFVDLGHPVWALLFSCFQNDLAPKYVSAPDKGCSRSYIYIFILLWNLWAHLIKVVQEAIPTFLFCFEICERTWSRLFKKLYLHFYLALKYVSAPDQGCSRLFKKRVVRIKLSIYIFIVISDVRVNDWPMMSSPWPCVFILVAYLIFIKMGPTIMKGRQPMELKYVLIVYNVAMVMLSGYICFQVSYFLILLKETVPI
jgi:hypothetical protein